MPFTARRIAPALLAVALTVALPACSRDTAPAASGQIRAPSAPRSTDPAAHRIEADVRALADDRMHGRETGTAGFDLAAEHVAERFAAIGLAPSGDDGSWFQRVPLLRGTIAADGARLEVHRNGEVIALAFQDEFLPMANFNQPLAEVDAPAVFVGQAVHAPELGHDDFAGLDLRGKVAMMLGGAPAGFDDTRRAFHGSLQEKLRGIAERGAVGVVLVGTADDEVRLPWARSAAGWDKPALRLRDDDGRGIDTWPGLKVVARVSAAAADALLAGHDRSAAQLLADARAGTLRGFDLPGTLSLAVRTRVEPMQSRNVVGLLRGADPMLADEYVVHTAHLDHVGVGAEVEGDTIHNGAIDNALGVAVMLEAARELQAGETAPRRSQLFVALTGEEQGLLGSQWFAQRPTVPRGSLVANINIDMPVLTAPSRDVVSIGVQHSSLKAVVDAAAAEIGVAVSSDPFPEEAVFVRSDQFSFVRAGIPAVYLDGGVEPVDTARDPRVSSTWFMRNCYHRPCDDATLPIHYDDAARLARLSARIAWQIGAEDARPRWNDGDFFGERFAGAKPQVAVPGARAR
ncbi:M28 family metallopeptidase [Luteimonas sp. MC1825]|uniref:M28 family metallopeptidase n=1 Tax=Luteimonas sp. MC1825 TaxID=2761107 RepID=UPI001611C38D|nr:M28 family metallopeptidase [Luteimonas sp. MC1825]MBB6598048.1 M28 family peptidase [Luteimonas sp. MC1825]QOC88285.1 M28 family peptidase [Luteimonas sp. MC1825]